MRSTDARRQSRSWLASCQLAEPYPYGAAVPLPVGVGMGQRRPVVAGPVRPASRIVQGAEPVLGAQLSGDGGNVGTDPGMVHERLTGLPRIRQVDVTRLPGGWEHVGEQRSVDRVQVRQVERAAVPGVRAQLLLGLAGGDALEDADRDRVGQFGEVAQCVRVAGDEGGRGRGRTPTRGCCRARSPQLPLRPLRRQVLSCRQKVLVADLTATTARDQRPLIVVHRDAVQPCVRLRLLRRVDRRRHTFRTMVATGAPLRFFSVPGHPVDAFRCEVRSDTSRTVVVSVRDPLRLA